MILVAGMVVAILLPTVAAYAVIGAVSGCGWLAERRRHPGPPEPVEQLAVRLRRLRAELESTENRPAALTAKNHRVKVLRGAYLDELSAACLRLGVRPAPGGHMARLADIYQAESELRQRGLDVREKAAL